MGLIFHCRNRLNETKYHLVDGIGQRAKESTLCWLFICLFAFFLGGGEGTTRVEGSTPSQEVPKALLFFMCCRYLQGVLCFLMVLFPHRFLHFFMCAF